MVKGIVRNHSIQVNKEISKIKKVYTHFDHKIREVFTKVHSKKETSEATDRPMSAHEIHHLLDDLKSSKNNDSFNKLLRNYGGKIINPNYLLSQINLIQDKHSRNSALNKLVEFELKIIGHDFDVGGEIKVKNKKTHSFLKIIDQKIFGSNARFVNFEGYNRTKAHGKVADSMENFILSKGSPSEKDTKIIDALNKSVKYDSGDLNAKAKEILNDIKSGNPVTIPTGWQGHAVEVTIHNGFLCYSNRGRSTENFKSGMHVYQINPDKIDTKFIKKLLQTNSYYPNIYTIFLRLAEMRHRRKWFESEGGMLKDLDARKLTTIPKTPQSVGNCTFTAAKCGAEALELLLELAESSDIPSVVNRIEKNSKEFEFFMRKEQFSFFLSFMNDIQKSDRKGKILSEASEFRVISEMCQKFCISGKNQNLDEILENNFSINNYKIENCVVDLHSLSKKACDGYVNALMENAYPGAFIVYKDRNKNICIDVKKGDGSQIHRQLDLKNVHSLSELNLDLKFPVASHSGLRWVRKNVK